MAAQETATPATVGVDEDALETAWGTIEAAAERHDFGGAVSQVIRHGQLVLDRATGWAVREPESERTPMRRDAIFDLASITKVVATTPAILKLIASGEIGLDQPVGEILPEFGTEGAKAEVTIRRLMAHSSGVISWRGVFTEGIGGDAYIASLARDQPENVPGEQVDYSCMGFITLAEVLRRVTGEDIATFATREVFVPLGMTDTMFTPPASLRNRIVATEQGNVHETGMTGDAPAGGWRDYLLRGEVHDGNAWYGFGGISGNAGLFGTASDLARYARMWLNGGELDGVRILPEAIVREATTEQTGLEGPSDRRGLGWQMTQHPGFETDGFSGLGLSQRAYGHTGFTGTSLWIDPERDLIIILLTNRVHPSVNAAYLPTRASYTKAIARACS
ncbi:MAG TPA: serine hydrolase domain-containing protein [Thermomicrobiales bacterium]|nr:serine hydrolase domain-containing protein [Thermomicrobiales bacterium]